MIHAYSPLPTHYEFRVGEIVGWDPEKIEDLAIAAFTVMKYGIGPFRILYIVRPHICNCRQRNAVELTTKPHDETCTIRSERAHPQTLHLEGPSPEPGREHVLRRLIVSGWYMVPLPNLDGE